MKNFSVLLLLATAGLFFGCDNAVTEQRGNGLNQFREDPVTITWKGDANGNIQSYQANVEVFTKNSRKDTAATLSETYRIAVRAANDKVLTRIDFNFGEGIPFRSIVSNGEEVVVFNPLTDEIGYRIPIEEKGSPLCRLFENQTGLSRMNLSLVRDEAKRLSLNLQENAASKELLLELPPALIPQNGADTITRSRAVFNIANDTLVETEVVMVREDGTAVTTTVNPVYEDKNGVPVKIGQVTVIDSKAPGLIEGISPDMPVYESLDDIPTIDDSKYEEMMANGNLQEISGVTFGNPADLSYTETIYEVYRDIEINAVPEQLFRVIQQ